MDQYQRDGGNDAIDELSRLVGQPDPFVASNSFGVPAGDFEIEEIAGEEADDAFLAELEDDLAVSLTDEDGAEGDDLDIDAAFLEDELLAEPAATENFSSTAPGFATAGAFAPRKSASRRLVPIAAALLLTAGVGAAGVYGYGAVTEGGSDEVPLITADASPIKSTVDGPSGREIPHQNKLVYERVSDGEPEVEQATLLPGPETVRELPLSDGRVAPRKVRTVTVRPDGSIIRDGALPMTQPVSAPAEQPISSQQVARTVPVRVISAAGETPVRQPSATETAALSTFSEPEPVDDIAALALRTSTSPSPITTSEAPAPEVPAAAAENADAPAETILAALPPAKPANLVAPSAAPAVAETPQPEPEPAQVVDVPESGWMVQLTSQRSEAQARDAFVGIKERHASVLGGSSPAIARADLGDRGIFYRVRVATGSRGEADQMCGALKARGGDCFVQYVN